MAITGQERPSFAPKNWGGWLAVGLLQVLGQMPHAMGSALSRPLGWFMMHLMRGRQRIVRRNIERCFPELDAAQTEKLMSVCRMRNPAVIAFINEMDREGQYPLDLLADVIAAKLSLDQPEEQRRSA